MGRVGIGDLEEIWGVRQAFRKNEKRATVSPRRWQVGGIRMVMKIKYSKMMMICCKVIVVRVFKILKVIGMLQRDRCHQT